MRPLGITLIACGVLLAIPQIVTTYPYQPFIALGLLFAVAGGPLICDIEPREAAEKRGEHGHHHR